MEQELGELVAANSETNRTKWALEYKAQGKKVIGVFDPHMPEELIHAAGMLPWRVTGTWKDSIPLASVYRLAISCGYPNHVLESLLAGELDFLDGAVFTAWDDDMRTLYDNFYFSGKIPLVHIMYLPHKATKLTLNYWAGEVERLRKRLEEFGGKRIDHASLSHSMAVFDEMRSLLMKLYQLRRGAKPAISGAEALGITIAARVMPKEEFTRRLRGLLPYLAGREAPLKGVKPRLLVSSDFLDDPRYLGLIEDTGAVVAMDDLDTGSRYFWNGMAKPGGDLILALARYYLTRPADPHTDKWAEEVGQVIQWARDFRVDGVIQLALTNCFPRETRLTYFSQELTKAGIPNMTFKRDYQLTKEGQLRTRIEAFLETLEG
ncbi:MAG TPA: 2-hydroxyacyl-CoA dehydratase [Dehalococcoidia bacterium]|nr:2-hydroxyacyl-CoA dehydratase [Dehalococcoidia bacterium]